VLPRPAAIARRIVDQWPPFGLVLHAPRLELRCPGPDQLAESAVSAAGGMHA